jgi:hypothetical protein
MSMGRSGKMMKSGEVDSMLCLGKSGKIMKSGDHGSTMSMDAKSPKRE